MIIVDGENIKMYDMLYIAMQNAIYYQALCFACDDS